MIKNCLILGDLRSRISKLLNYYEHLLWWRIIGIKVACFNPLRLLQREGMNMGDGEYYVGVGKTADPNYPRLILGYRLQGEKVEIYKNREAYIVVNTKTEKYLTCLGWKHAHYVFEECVRTLAPVGLA